MRWLRLRRLLRRFDERWDAVIAEHERLTTQPDPVPHEKGDR